MKSDQIVILPNLEAGCPMADMALLDEVEKAWEHLTSCYDSESIIPVTYINSSADIKAFCGKNGGTVCTSSNSAKILKWALEQGNHVLFFPDQHLGRNTAHQLGITDDRIFVWQKDQADGGLSDELIQSSQIILWNGYCYIHQSFLVSEIEKIKLEQPEAKIIVHPECPREIIEVSDFSGSTNEIIETVKNSADGSHWVVGTEFNMVNRLKSELDGSQKITFLPSKESVCKTMNLNHPRDLLGVLENILEGNIVHQITVNDEIKQLAKLALDRMLSLS